MNFIKNIFKKEKHMACHGVKIEDLEEMKNLREYVSKMNIHSCTKDPILKVIDFELSLVERSVYIGLGEIHYNELKEKNSGKN
jgi:hypothetical protein